MADHFLHRPLAGRIAPFANGLIIERLEPDSHFLPLSEEDCDRIVANDIVDIGLGVRREFIVRRASTDHHRLAINSRTTSRAMLLSYPCRNRYVINFSRICASSLRRRRTTRRFRAEVTAAARSS